MSDEKSSEVRATEAVKDGEWFNRHPYVAASVFWLMLFSVLTTFQFSNWNSKETFFKDQIASLKEELSKRESTAENYHKESLLRQQVEWQKTRTVEELERAKSELSRIKGEDWEAKFTNERLEHSALKEKFNLSQTRLEGQISSLDAERKMLCEKILSLQRQLDEKPFKNGEKLTETLSAFDTVLKEKAGLREEISKLKLELSDKERLLIQLNDDLSVAKSTIAHLRKMIPGGSTSETDLYSLKVNALIASLGAGTFSHDKAAMLKRGVSSLGMRIKGADFVRMLNTAAIAHDNDATPAITFCAPYLVYPLDEKSMAGIIARVTFSHSKKAVLDALMNAQDNAARKSE